MKCAFYCFFLYFCRPKAKLKTDAMKKDHLIKPHIPDLQWLGKNNFLV